MNAVSSELAINRANTKRFIALDPTEIVLIPRQEVWANGSKKKTDLPPRASQTFKIIWGGDTGIVTTIGGTTRRFDFVIMGNVDASLEIGDHWFIGDQDNEVQYIFPSNGYEIKGGGVSHGSKPVG